MKSPVWQFFVNGEGENNIGIYSGANSMLTPACVARLGDLRRGCTADAAGITAGKVLADAKIARAHNMQVILNPAPATQLSDELLALIDIITPNETKAEILTGIAVKSDEDAAQVLHDKGIGTVLITLGRRGVWLSEQVREKVDQTIRELNYAPSALERSLKIKQTRTIGVLLTASSNPFYSEVVRGVENSCYERRYSLILCNTEGDEERMNRSLETLMQKRIDGLLMMCTTETHLPSAEILDRYPFCAHGDDGLGTV